jgi:outer membrane biosynthesis protein TonB
VNQPAPPRARKSRFQRAGVPTAPTAEPEDQAAPAPAPAPAPPAPARPEPTAAPAPSAPQAAPADSPEPETWDARMSMTLSRQMKRDLDLARTDDGIEGTARVRAMIRLWQQDERLRRRVDKLAKSLR